MRIEEFDFAFQSSLPENIISVALLALSAVIGLTFVWELGEYVGDRLFDTALIPSERDSAEDILFGTAGGLVGITFAGVVRVLAARRLAARGPGDEQPPRLRGVRD
jgi:hypothetical protein